VTAGQFVDVPGTASIILAGVVNHFAASRVELPDRRFIAPGDTRAVAWDCESVTVTCGGILWGQGPGVSASVGRGTGNPVSVGARYAVFAVQIVRSTADVEHDGEDPPPPPALTKAGLAMMVDMGLLSQALVELAGKNGPLSRAGMATAGDVVPLGPSGMFAATEGHLAVTVASLKAG
jgi:hypothetical protein